MTPLKQYFPAGQSRQSAIELVIVVARVYLFVSQVSAIGPIDPGSQTYPLDHCVACLFATVVC